MNIANAANMKEIIALLVSVPKFENPSQIKSAAKNTYAY